MRTLLILFQVSIREFPLSKVVVGRVMIAIIAIIAKGAKSVMIAMFVKAHTRL